MYKEPERPRFVKGYGRNWERLREREGFNKTDFAKKLEIDKALVTKFENESKDHKPTLALMYKCQDLFNVPVDYLTGFMKVSDLDTVATCELMPISDRAWCTLQSCDPEILSMILESPEFQHIVEDYAAIKTMWENKKDIDSDEAQRAYEFKERHKDELSELNCSVILHYGIEQVKDACKYRQFDIMENNSSMHRRIMKRITDIDILER